MTSHETVSREAVISDVPSIDQLVNSAYRGESSKQGWTTEADLLGGQRIDPQGICEILVHPTKTILCLVDESQKIVGAVCLERFEDTQGVGVYLGMLTVDPAKQTSGLGKRLMVESENFARTWGATFMTLGVIGLREELMAWYERRGFQKNGKIEPFPYGDARFGEPKRSDLQFVMFSKVLR